MLLLMNHAMISVIIPTCHRNDLLAKCLDCLAPGIQTLPANQYEVIVTDDGSKSTAEEMVREQYPWVRWVAGPKRGPAANRNNGVKYIAGEWLAFTDDDCLPEPGWLQAYASAVTQGINAYEGKTTCREGLSSPMMEAPINLTGGLLNSCNMLVSRTVFEALSGFDEAFPNPAMEDWEFYGRLKAQGHSTIFVGEAVVDHPPRRSHWGRQYAKLLESHAYAWYKSGNTRPFKTTVLFHMMVGRLIRLSRFRVSSDTVIAFASWIVEVAYIIQASSEWERKYRKQFVSAQP